MAQQLTPAAGSGHIEALRQRALSSLFFTALHTQAPEHESAFQFWSGYLKALKDLGSGCASAAALRDADRSGYEPPSYLKAAFAALPVGAEFTTVTQVQQFLAAQGVQVPGNAVAYLQADVVQQLEDGKGRPVDLHYEHAAPMVDGCDGAGGAHGGSQGQVDGFHIVAGEVA